MTRFAVHFACGTKYDIKAKSPDEARSVAQKWYLEDCGDAFITGRITKVKAKGR